MNTKLSVLPLLPGESPLPKAPCVVLDDGTNCIPQHYLSYQHTKQSVENIVAHIDFDPKFILFVDEDQASIFIQVGIIGKDNYINAKQQEAEKIVYGRRWRVEPQLPSSEIIQTALLALTKAREHEIRELFKYASHPSEQKRSVTTPFSCHHDLPLIAMSRAINIQQEKACLSIEQIEAVLNRIRYDKASFVLEHCTSLENQYLLAFKIIVSQSTALPELLATQALVYLLLDELTEDALLHGIMDKLLHMSNRFVEENFTFKEFARFSRLNSIQKISELSAKTRILEKNNQDGDFSQAFAHANYETDSTRVPRLSTGKLGNKIKQQLTRFDIKFGILPKIED